jgi:lipid-A-disaccharide synthase
VLFPFEVEFFARHGVEAEWYGHPLAHRIANETADRRERALNLFDRDKPIVAYLPGSRDSELMHHVRPMVRVAENLGPSYRHVVGVAPTVSEERVQSETGNPSVPIHYCHDTETLLEAASAAVVKSGTANLVAALIGTPFVSVYRTSPLSYAIGRRLAKVDSISIVNILLKQRVVPEFVQKALQPSMVAAEIERLIHDERAKTALTTHFARVAAELDRPGAYESAAASLVQLTSNTVRSTKV